MNGRAGAPRMQCAHPRVRALAVVALATVGGAAAGGCANGRVSDQDTARGTAQTFLAQCAAQRAERVMEVLNRSARNDFIGAGGASAGCAAVLGVPDSKLPGGRSLREASLRLTRFDGSQASFAVDAGGRRMRLALTYGAEGWLIEGPW